jgi:DNA-binding response OmpR family regulator
MNIIVVAHAQDAAPVVEAFESRGDKVKVSDGIGSWTDQRDLAAYQLLILFPFEEEHYDQVCNELRRRALTVPIVVAMKPHAGSSDRVRAFKAGADDCISAPYDIEELLLRSDALVRRSANAYDYPQRLGPILLKPSSRELFVDGKLTPIPFREFELLSLLVRNAGRTVTRSEIILALWGARRRDSNVIEVHVRRVRAKLGRHEGLLQTVRGEGYCLAARPIAPATQPAPRRCSPSQSGVYPSYDALDPCGDDKLVAGSI